MKKGIAMLLLSTLVVACAPIQKKPVMDESQVAPIPVCTNERQCEAMWSNSQDVLSIITGMKLRMATATTLETFSPGRRGSAGRMYGQARKMVRPDGTYAIIAVFNCGYEYCRGDEIKARHDFNELITLAGAAFK